MRVHDPLYGSFVVPPYLARLVMTPEVRRLSQIRLLNALSPSLAALGELRRYSHTLGVLYLCQKNQSPGYTNEERKALAASVLLHDIGTPPFGHLFEYHLREQKGWSHEGVIRDVLWGFHMPENRAHQPFGGRTIEFRDVAKKSGISFELVQNIVCEKHPLSRLLFGTMDLDNLDNVARMGWALGMNEGAPCAEALAAKLCVRRDSTLQLPMDAREVVKKWAALRRKVYDIIVFDPQTVAAQAVLSEAIGKAIASGFLDESDWALTDESLLEVLRSRVETKDYVVREYLGRLPELAFGLQIRGTLLDLGLADRSAAKALIEAVLRSESQTENVLGYVFVDKGAFEKRLKFVDPGTAVPWEEGQVSGSVVFYGFVRSGRGSGRKTYVRALQIVMDRLRVAESDVIRKVIGSVEKREDDQLAFD